ncbi:carbonic anhydrase 6-like [Culicoides brevitarsis]|uniref:carbonic anhydrase 6-like n=1 Tax=Culicoides brevitarsis TaxID=469753 RepID=UPI00307BCC4A
MPLWIYFCFLNLFTGLNDANQSWNRSKREAVTLQPYNYRTLGRFGQRNWRTHYPKCGLNNQSPIDIDLKQVKPGDFPTNLRTTNIDTKPLEIEIRNNGYTALVKYFWPCCPPKIYGGPLTDVYEFVGLHFHWGTDDKSGTEHSVDGQHGAMEAHMIFKNERYESKEKALDHNDGLTVFACRFKCDPTAPPFNLLEGVRLVSKWGDTAKSFYPDTVPLTELIGSPDFHYAFYHGGLTTPPCSESVQWIVNLNLIPMNCSQLNYLRAMKDKRELEISGNFREIQKLNNRSVFIS